MSEKTVLITGANRGLGLSLAQTFRARGDTVIGACRNPSAATALRALGAETLTFDASDLDSVVAIGDACADRQLDVVINGAGIDARAVGASELARGPLELGATHFEAVMRVNVTAPYLLVQALGETLRRSKSIVVNVSSQIGSFELARRMGRDVSYATSKAALNMVTLKQAQALGPDGVTVIALHPGWLRTEMGGAAADLDPDEAARDIVRTIDALTTADNGRFLRWDGTEHPW